MSVWGKVIGATAGMLLGGPLGALAGAVAGHYSYDRDSKGSSEEKKQLTFTIGVIALSAKMAKADGVVTRDEINAFREVFHVPEDQVKNVARVFDLAKKDIAGYEAYAKQISDAFSDDPKTLENVLDGLFHIAEADGVIHEKELEFVAKVAAIFGFEQAKFDKISGRHVQSVGENPYVILGVEASATDAEIKRAYRDLVKENHPDALTARGVPEEFIEIANKKLAKINKAYDVLKKQRDL